MTQRVSIVRLAPQIGLLLGGIALGVALVILLLHSVNLSQLGADFHQVNYALLVLALVFFAINLGMKVPRWALLLGDDAPDWDTLFGAINVGYAVNTLLPLRLGDLVRAYWVRDRAGIPMVRALSTIALERVADGVTVLILFLVLAPTVAFPAALRGSALAAGGLFIAVLLFMLLLAYNASRDTRFSRLLVRIEQSRLSIVGQIIRQIAAGLRTLRSGRAVALLTLYTAIIWGSNAVLLWLVIRAFHLNAPFAAGVLGNAVVSLGMTVPSTPGYIGLFDYLIVVTLGLYGVSRTPALAAALVFHAIAFVPVTLIGVVYIARTGVRLTAEMLRASATR
ncbi:MAG: lysylphosphatidylglycerol synthase transmembrane domain-containing protein [Chloroflexota bacterium]